MSTNVAKKVRLNVYYLLTCYKAKYQECHRRQNIINRKLIFDLVETWSYSWYNFSSFLLVLFWIYWIYPLYVKLWGKRWFI